MSSTFIPNILKMKGWLPAAMLCYNHNERNTMLALICFLPFCFREDQSLYFNHQTDIFSAVKI
jgi:hypothetical protein